MEQGVGLDELKTCSKYLILDFNKVFVMAEGVNFLPEYTMASDTLFSELLSYFSFTFHWKIFNVYQFSFKKMSLLASAMERLSG